MEEVKVTLNNSQTPSNEPAAPVGKIYVSDDKGRRIRLEEPDILAPYRLVDLVGAASAENSVYMAMVFPFLYVTEIDGDTVFTPASKRELEALIKRLGHDGIKALREGVEKHFAKKSEAEQKAAIKN